MVLTDEEQPLLRILSHDLDTSSTQEQPNCSSENRNDALEFEPFDPEDPKNWGWGFKWGIVSLLALMAFTVTFTCIGVVPVASEIVRDLDHGQSMTSTNSALLVTIWELGEAAGPLLIAPLSEILGRRPVMHACNFGFIAATILAACSQSSSIFIVARMLTGLCVASNVLNPAIIGDIFSSEQRGSAMSLIMLAPLIGGAIGPAISGVIAQTMGWRRILVIAAALAVLCEVLFLAFFRETYKMAILKRREEDGRAEGELMSHEPKSAHAGAKRLWHSITRPFAVLFGSSVLMLLSLFASVAFSYFYVISVSLPVILVERYGFELALTGSSFVSFSIGSFLSVLVCNFTLDRIYMSLRSRSSASGKGKPEYRLPLSIIGGILLPFSVTAYGWIAEYRLPALLLLASVSLMGFTLLLTVVPLSAYVIDACGIYSASAMTGVIVTRCLVGTFLPLTTGPLAEALGYGWGFSCLGALSLVLAVIPVMVSRFGEGWRQRSEFTMDS
ncbi:major facilitator superfamily transporter [Pyrenophora seminiperda CCB06]|uniref:Major facilitator superfamily transporter n=1 Tax=Pyrenophora seminiperda CCB06 TaxID=1302712 RepID=A0A3M7LXS7_9PLEO|nr:major facilitator superfamily transporter [Pyrenophora seminiperda CCB06]